MANRCDWLPHLEQNNLMAFFIIIGTAFALEGNLDFGEIG